MRLLFDSSHFVGICCLFIACNNSHHHHYQRIRVYWNVLSFFVPLHSFIYLYLFIFFSARRHFAYGKKLLCRLMYWIFDEASEFECRCFYIIGASTKCYMYKEIAFPVKLFDIVYRFLHTHIHKTTAHFWIVRGVVNEFNAKHQTRILA